MPSIENLLRDELMRVTDTVQPGQLRPLRIPAPGLRWRHRLLPVAAAAAIIAVAVSAVLVAGPKLAPASAPDTAAVPRYYLTFTFAVDPQFHNLPVTEAMIRDTATGKITGTVKIVTNSFPASVAATAAPDGRSFILGTAEHAPKGEYRFFRLPISAGGKPGHLTELPAYPVPVNAFITGIALSPDGTRLAVSSSYGVGGSQDGPAAAEVGAVEVINLVTGAVRTWTADMQQGHWYQPGQPSWADGNRMIAFTWQQAKSMSNDAMTMEGVRLLDTEAPGDNLADARMIMPAKAVNGTINSVLITPDGRDVLVATSRDGRGTVVVQISEVPTAGSGPVRVLHTETARATATTQGMLTSSSQVLSLAPGGRYALVQCIQFGWLDLDSGRFTPLPAYSPTPPGQIAIIYGVW
jgi:DNA-binding beta-propeller fold protein YncE